MTESRETQVDRELEALVAADPATATRPDLAALRAGGRRRLARRRTALGAGVLAVVAAVAIPTALVVVDRDEQSIEAPIATEVPSAPTETPSAPPSEAGKPGNGAETGRPEGTRDPVEEGEIRLELPGGMYTDGLRETGRILGEQVTLGQYGGYDRVLYAARPTGSPEADAWLSLGLRDGGRIARQVVMLTPLAAGYGEDKVMWGGAREEADELRPGPAPTYTLVGALAGDVDVSIAGEGESPRPVTGRSTTLLPGVTVFWDEAPWDASWDPNQYAPLTVTTSDGQTLSVRERSYVS